MCDTVSVIWTVNIWHGGSELWDNWNGWLIVLQCTDYKHERVAGNLCPHLCQMHTVWFHSCMNYRGGKNVFKMKWMDEMIILKSKKPRIDDYDLPLYTSLLSDFTGMVAQSVSMNLPVAQKALTDAQIFSIMWMDDVEKYATRRTVGGEEEVLWQSSAMNSLWSLVQQDEYMILKFFQHFPHMPRIFGTCGHFYALEYMPPGPMLSAGILEMTRIFGHSWSDRAKLALKLLETIHAFDNDLTEVLHMCDMKGENFGISKAGKVVAIDVDMAVFDTKLVSDLSYPNCSIHDDCSFFDCQGWCDIPNQKCSGIRVNNNLQVCGSTFSIKCPIFSFAVPPGSGAFQMPTRPSSSASTLRGGRANLRNASVTFSLFLAWSFFRMTLTTYHKKDLVASL